MAIWKYVVIAIGVIGLFDIITMDDDLGKSGPLVKDDGIDYDSDDYHAGYNDGQDRG